MVSTSNPNALPDGLEPASGDAAPTNDDLLALIPDMELLETSASDALAAHSAMAAAAGSSRTPVTTPQLSDVAAAPTVRIAAAQTSVSPGSDDPYADLMPELEPFEQGRSAAVPAPAAPKAALPAAPKAPAAPARPVAPARPQPSSVAPTTPKSQAAPAPAGTPRTPPAPAKPATPPKPAAPAAGARKAVPPNPESVMVPPVMDREFIARNHIVELYLSGRLPVRGATVFEKFCRENPQILDEIGLPERVHTGLRLLESAGKPEPWQEKPKQFWERPYVPAALSALVLVLGIALLVLNRQLADQTHKAATLQQLVTDQPLDAATGTSTVDIQPTHIGPNVGNSTVVGGSAATLVNIKIDETHSDFRAFRVTIDRLNQGRVAVLNNLIKDSNGELTFSLNSSALGAGIYQLAIEGLDWRGDPQPDSWASITIKH